MKEALIAYSENCVNKANTKVFKMIVKAMLAGMFIAFGAAGSSVAAHSISDVGLARLVSGCVFPVGLMMVVLTGAELFTGDCLVILGTLNKKIRVIDIVKILVLVYVGNFFGSFLLAAGIYVSGQLNYTGGLLGAYTIKVALGKCNLSFATALVSGILCNILVSLAVLMCACAKEIAGKLLAAFFVIMLFVVCGFEHCVANMYYIPAGLLAKLNPQYVEVAMEKYGYTADQIASLNWTNFWVSNQIPVTIGNIIGGMFVIGAVLWYIHNDKKANS